MRAQIDIHNHKQMIKGEFSVKTNDKNINPDLMCL